MSGEAPPRVVHAEPASAVDGSVPDATTGRDTVVGFPVGDSVTFASDTIRLPIGPLGLGLEVRFER